jgi:HAD superfamily hydrolase (TIGR01549 family)
MSLNRGILPAEGRTIGCPGIRGMHANPYEIEKEMMPGVKGIGFDLFGTLVLQERFSFDQCLDALFSRLVMSGIALEKESFVQAYRGVNRRLMAEAMANGRETQNRLWVAGALNELGVAIEPHDPRVKQAVEAYFEPFIRSCQLIPGTGEMLEALVGHFPLALLSNFTHPPALDEILARLQIQRFFEAILVSGRLGIRKPHADVFAQLAADLGLAAADMLFVGDELQSDIIGAKQVGMRTVWMTYRQNLERPSPLGHFLGMSEDVDHVQPDHVVGNWQEFLTVVLEKRE